MWGNKNITGKGVLNGRNQLRGDSRLNNITERARRETPANKIGIKVDCQKHDPRLTSVLLQTISGIDTTKNWHRNIGHYDVGFQSDGLFKQGLPVANFSDHFELPPQDALRDLWETRMVICQQYRHFTQLAHPEHVRALRRL